MSKIINEDINDDEIRIISSDAKPLEKSCSCYNCAPGEAHVEHPDLMTSEDFMLSDKPRKHNKWLWLIIAIIIIILLVIIGVLLTSVNDTESNIESKYSEEVISTRVNEPEPAIVAQPRSSVLIKDTIINGNELRIYEPQNAIASLVLGEDMLADSTIILATRAADIRHDNGEILGTFVLNGELKSTGESKAGFCAIIDGKATVGVADATPMLEQTLTEGGYFFRQYPLVVGGQTVENKPKGKAVRKALAEIGNRTCVIVSKDKLTFGEFSETLTAAGVRNAIYLCGGNSFGFYNDESGKRQRIDNGTEILGENVSFIIWR